MMTVTAFIEQQSDGSYVAWAKDIPGLVVQGATMEEAQRELLLSLKIKIAYDNKLDLSCFVEEKGVVEEHLPVRVVSNHGTEYQLALA